MHGARNCTREAKSGNNASFQDEDRESRHVELLPSISWAEIFFRSIQRTAVAGQIACTSAKVNKKRLHRTTRALFLVNRCEKEFCSQILKIDLAVALISRMCPSSWSPMESGRRFRGMWLAKVLYALVLWAFR